VQAIKVSNKEQKNDLFTDMLFFQTIKPAFLKRKEKIVSTKIKPAFVGPY